MANKRLSIVREVNVGLVIVRNKAYNEWLNAIRSGSPPDTIKSLAGIYHLAQRQLES